MFERQEYAYAAGRSHLSTCCNKKGAFPAGTHLCKPSNWLDLYYGTAARAASAVINPAPVASAPQQVSTAGPAGP